jgi:glutaredoxin 3
MLTKFTEKQHIKELDQLPNTNEYQDYLEKITGGKTVPRIFINHKFFGGCSDVVRSIRKLCKEVYVF